MTPTLSVLLNHLWQSTLVGLVAWLLCATTLRSNAARLRFSVWMVASLKFLVPATILISLGRRFGTMPVITPSQSQGIFDVLSASAPVVAPAFTVTAPPQATVPWQWPALIVLFVVWIAGALFIAARWIAQWRTIWRLTRTAERTGEFQDVPVMRSFEMSRDRIEPGVIGMFRPAILLPDGIEGELSASQLEAVLTHERQHARRRDNVWAALHTLVQVLFWFHPLVWLIGRRLADEREKACDQAALVTASPEDYAEGLLSVCKLYWRASQGHVTGMGGADLRARMESILNGVRPVPTTRLQRVALATALMVLVAGAPFAGWLTAQALAPEANSFLGFATSADKKFEVASVKPSAPDQQGGRLGPPGRGAIEIINLPLRGIIIQSFRSQRWMVFGGPDWITTERFDIVGKGPDPRATNPEVWEMMRSLLIDRFQLKYHVEEREMAVFALTVAKSGSKLTPGEKGRCASEIKEGKACGDILVPQFGTGIYNMPIGALVTGMAGRAGRPVVDRTGLTGRYDVNLSWMPDGMTHEQWESLPRDDRPEEVTLFEAVERQAGLKLEPSRAIMKVLVIDQVEHPTPN